MKQILLKIGLTLVLLFCIDRVAYYSFKHVFFDKIISGEKGGSLNFLLQKKRDVDFFILGTSRAKYQIDPTQLTNAYYAHGFNAAISGIGAIVYNNVLLDIITSQGIKPKLVILQTDAYQFSDIEDDKVVNELIPLYPFMNKSEVLSNYIHDAPIAERAKLFLKTYQFNGKVFNVLVNYTKRNSVKDYTGFVSVNSTMKETQQLRKEDMHNDTFTFSAIKVNALKSITDICKKSQIRLIVVLPPSYENNLYNRVNNMQIEKIVQENSTFPVLDLSNVEALPSLRPRTQWLDFSHLNGSGAVTFSKILNDSLAGKIKN